MKNPNSTNVAVKADITNRILISPSEVCQLLGIGKTTVYKLIHEGVIPVIKLPYCRKLYISVDALKSTISSYTVSLTTTDGGDE